MDSKQYKIVYNVVERGERHYWTRVGAAFTNRDGSLSVRLDAIPLNGNLQVRDWSPREDGVNEPSSRSRSAGIAKPPAQTAYVQAP